MKLKTERWRKKKIQNSIINNLQCVFSLLSHLVVFVCLFFIMQHFKCQHKSSKFYAAWFCVWFNFLKLTFSKFIVSVLIAISCHFLSPRNWCIFVVSEMVGWTKYVSLSLLTTDLKSECKTWPTLKAQPATSQVIYEGMKLIWLKLKCFHGKIVVNQKIHAVKTLKTRLSSNDFHISHEFNLLESLVGGDFNFTKFHLIWDYFSLSFFLTKVFIHGKCWCLSFLSCLALLLKVYISICNSRHSRWRLVCVFSIAIKSNKLVERRDSLRSCFI